ncbi:MAG TPA: maleylpyruvate isomerase family mycothiol-dependent enzyme [Intrasporangium sp.]|uniref:maleylpyruvate isomerase family mycothiol-dependent enzyme n=1 Tax=Intrasporangium sp. TaxID=1925024 RepID=UPI002D789BA6|nr:maleylpyruvate isomerase family mycothiol-dependent enzyme [Intrasporangium sp.]HET7398858.1 maleylpyruvate isomerase family mycothiol-dependent enzyme [Intrasporangium sp.]
MTVPLELSQAWVKEGTATFERVLDGADDAGLDAPTGLPGWTGRHVVAHVAANADALGNLVHWARTGEERPMYSSPDARASEIAAGARRAAGELRAWLGESADRLDAGFASLTDEQWQRPVRTAQGRTVPASEVPWMRAREVMVHAVDLGAPVEGLPVDFVVALLDEIAAKRGASGHGPALELWAVDDARGWSVMGAGRPVTVRGPLTQLAAYLSGRPATGLRADDDTVPTLPRWL